MPGFSKMEQARLSLLALAHRGTLGKARDLVAALPDLKLLFALRLAALFHRSRRDIGLPRLEVFLGDSECALRIEREWLERNPLTDTALHSEVEEWTTLGFDLRIRNWPEGSKADKADKSIRSTAGA
jgi:exopolyphosphatase/guanosine-5'-triphosphate,3'-diphosphate pyrophosphatase